MKFKSIIIIILISNIISEPEEDLVKDLPDYPFEKKMYSGYLNITEIKKLHYIYLESEKDSDKLFIWFNGGPFCSSLNGWIKGHGPFVIEGNKLVKNPYSWNKLANMLYIESPAGAGFSILNSYIESELSMDDDIAAHDNLIAIIDFFNKFPSLRDKDLYISGESYAGIYIPMLAYEILHYNDKVSDSHKIKLKGILVGNGVADWKYDTVPAMIDFIFTHHLIGFELRKDYIKYCQKEIDEEKCNANVLKTLGLINNINVYDYLQDCQGLSNSNSIRNSYYFNYAKWAFPSSLLKSKNKHFLQIIKDENKSNGAVPCIDTSIIENYLNRIDVKKALHVDQSIKWEICNMEGYSRYRKLEKGSIYAYPYLLNKIRILIYSGDTDMAVPFNGNQAWIRNLRLPIISEWKSWRAEDLDGNVDMANIAGYRTIYKGLTFVTVKGTGHMVPQWKRKEAFHMVKRFLADEDL